MIEKTVQTILGKFDVKLKRIKTNDLNLYHEIYSKDDIQNKRFYNVGAGLFNHPAWTNIDYYSEWYNDNFIHINLNLLECPPFPVESDSALVVYTSHTTEHITDEASQNMFNEAHRILKKGGFIRITTPNIELYYRNFLYKNYQFWKNYINTYSIPKNMKRVGFKLPLNSVSLKQLFLLCFAGQTTLVHEDESTYKINDTEFDEIFAKYKFEDALDFIKSKCSLDIHKKYPGNHINWWSKDKLFRMLEEAGFTDIYLSAYNQSLCPIMHNTLYFDNTHPEISIYVEAKK